jgi:hypothetical protein
MAEVALRREQPISAVRMPVPISAAAAMRLAADFSLYGELTDAK